MAFLVALGAVVLVNSPAYHYVSAALAAYLGILVGIPLLSTWLKGRDISSEFGLRGVTSLPPSYFLAVLLLPLPLIFMLWAFPVAPTVAFAVVVAPFCEEFFFRGYLAGRLRGLGVVPSSVFSALLFGIFHLGALGAQGLPTVLVLVLLGLVYAPVFLLTNSVYVTSSAHAAWNLFAYLILVSPSTVAGYASYAVLGILVAADIFLALLEIMHSQRKAVIPAE
jgi:membrane protease YdiL (CAAX protease family)